MLLHRRGFSLNPLLTNLLLIAMSTQITITLPDEIYQRAKRFAKLANRDVASVLADTIQHSIKNT